MARHLRTTFDQTADETPRLLDAPGKRLHQVHASNVDALDYWIHFFDEAAAADVTLATNVPKYVVFVPAGDATLAGAVTENYGYEMGMDFQKGIVYAVKTVATTAGNTGTTTDLPATFITS